jgi:hypothetical protein
MPGVRRQVYIEVVSPPPHGITEETSVSVIPLGVVLPSALPRVAVIADRQGWIGCDSNQERKQAIACGRGRDWTCESLHGR